MINLLSDDDTVHTARSQLSDDDTVHTARSQFLLLQSNTSDKTIVQPRRMIKQPTRHNLYFFVISQFFFSFVIRLNTAINRILTIVSALKVNNTTAKRNACIFIPDLTYIL
jgi:hypothetical protein